MRSPERRSASRTKSTVTAMPPSATAMNTQPKVPRYVTCGRMADCVSASTSRAGRVPAANGVARAGNGSPEERVGPGSVCMKPERGYTTRRDTIGRRP